MAERFLIRMVGGPLAGTTRIATEDDLAWPLPDVLGDPEEESGVYRKRSESQLPHRRPTRRVLRGAEYEWEEAE